MLPVLRCTRLARDTLQSEFFIEKRGGGDLGEPLEDVLDELGPYFGVRAISRK
jgi:hypothetical protein